MRPPTPTTPELDARALCTKLFGMDIPTACPRLCETTQSIVQKDCVLSAERALSSLSLTTTKVEDAPVGTLRRSVSTGVTRSPGRRKPPRCPKPPASGAHRKRTLSDDRSTDGTTCPDHSSDDDAVQYTPRGSPAKLARSASLGRFTSVSNLAAFGGAAEKAEAGPPTVTVRLPTLRVRMLAMTVTALGTALTVASDCALRCCRGCGARSRWASAAYKLPASHRGRNIWSGGEKTLGHRELSYVLSLSALCVTDAPRGSLATLSPNPEVQPA